MSADTNPADDADAGAADRTGTDPLADALAEPLADPDAGVAVDDDPGQVDLNSEQWDTE
jgi:hypothetical protein